MSGSRTVATTPLSLASETWACAFVGEWLVSVQRVLFRNSAFRLVCLLRNDQKFDTHQCLYRYKRGKVCLYNIPPPPSNPFRSSAAPLRTSCICSKHSETRFLSVFPLPVRSKKHRRQLRLANDRDLRSIEAVCVVLQRHRV